MINHLNQIAHNMITNHSALGNALGAAKHSEVHGLTLGNGFAYGLIGLGAGIAMIGAIGSGGGQGIAAGRAAEAVGRNPQAESQIRNMMIIGDGVAASASIYALIISLLLIFVF